MTQQIPTLERVIALALASLGLGMVVWGFVFSWPLAFAEGWLTGKALVFSLSAAAALYYAGSGLCYAIKGVRLR